MERVPFASLTKAQQDEIRLKYKDACEHDNFLYELDGQGNVKSRMFGLREKPEGLGKLIHIGRHRGKKTIRNPSNSAVGVSTSSKQHSLPVTITAFVAFFIANVLGMTSALLTNDWGGLSLVCLYAFIYFKACNIKIHVHLPSRHG